MKVVEYYRQPTPYEIKFGEGATHYLLVDEVDVLKKDGTVKKWFIHTDGLRYQLYRSYKDMEEYERIRPH